MPSFDVGLQHRVKRLAQQTAEQHRQLSTLQREAGAALEHGARAEARASVERYAAALRAHFELEQGVFFPALHGFAPKRTSELDSLEQEHAVFLAELVQLARDVDSAPPERCRDAFAGHLGRLREHERREESLVAALSEQGR